MVEIIDNRRLVVNLMRKYIIKYASDAIKQMEWRTWDDVPAVVSPGQLEFKFEGNFFDLLTTTEVKVITLHEIAHFNAFTNQIPYEHGQFGQELIFIGLCRKEKISLDQVNSVLKTVWVKWDKYRVHQYDK